MLSIPFSQSELVLALIGPVGTEISKVRDILEERLKVSKYQVRHIRVTTDVIPLVVPSANGVATAEHARVMKLMDAGNQARQESGDHSILALGVAACIAGLRPKDQEGKPSPLPRQAYIVSSLKHPKEVERLREIYPQGFYLIGIHADGEQRLEYLMQDKRMPEGQAKELMARDEDEDLLHGQKVADAFHLSDFFIRLERDNDRLKRSLWRLLDLLLGDPYVTPTFDEYAMFLAFSASLTSADLSRQVGAVVAVNSQVVGTGANDCPKAGGGRYWPTRDRCAQELCFPEDGRDFVRGFDCNVYEQQKIIEEILGLADKNKLDRLSVQKILNESRIRHLTEFGRVVHAEMDALLSCARAQVPLEGGTLYTTTFPCHNCAKHIVAVGIARVLYIEPYPKSKAADFHPDSIQVGFQESDESSAKRPMVQFKPFVGVGPRRFFDLFSMKLGSGRRLKRKEENGKKIAWEPESGNLRLQMLPASYLDLEFLASSMFKQACENRQGGE